MVNNWVKVELYGANNDGCPRRYAIADGVGVSKGQLLALLDPRTCSASLTTTAAYAGVAAEEHIANQGVTSISVWTDGIFEAVASGTVGLGSPITGTDNNEVLTCTAIDASGAEVLGYSLETGSENETIEVRLRL